MRCASVSGSYSAKYNAESLKLLFSR